MKNDEAIYEFWSLLFSNNFFSANEIMAPQLKMEPWVAIVYARGIHASLKMVQSFSPCDARAYGGHNFWLSGLIGLKFYRELCLKEVTAVSI